VTTPERGLCVPPRPWFVVGDGLFIVFVGGTSAAVMAMVHDRVPSTLAALALGMVAGMATSMLAAMAMGRFLGSIEAMVPSMIASMVVPMVLCPLVLVGPMPSASWSATIGGAVSLALFAGIHSYQRQCCAAFRGGRLGPWVH
jgi:hypothetical protein